MIDTTQEYTKHKYIQVSDYEPYFETFAAHLSYPMSKPTEIMYLANLSLLLANLIILSGEWESTSPEERVLALGELDLAFPAKFTGERNVSDIYAMIELRTQIFVQHFLEQGRADDWNTNIQLGEIFKVQDMRSIPSTATAHACLRNW